MNMDKYIFVYKYTHTYTPLDTHTSQKHSSAHKGIKAPVCI